MSPKNGAAIHEPIKTILIEPDLDLIMQALLIEDIADEDIK